MERPTSWTSHADAAARLAYADAIRTRARRAALLPSFVVPLGLGLVIAVHGVVLGLVPRGELTSIAWIAGLIAARPLLRWRSRRDRSGRVLLPTDRLLVACVAAGVVAAVAAIETGASPMVSCLAAATAARAQLSGLRLVAAGVLLLGAAADAVMLGGAPVALVELLTGTALVVAALAWRGLEGRA